MKKIFMVFVILLIGFSVSAQETKSNCDSTYYNSLAGFSGTSQQLKTALHYLVDGHTRQPYPLWQWFDNTDLLNSDTIWDIYSDNCNFIFDTSRCSAVLSPTNYCNCYNHEHSFPAGWFGNHEYDTMYTDLFHVYPVDGWVNNLRGSFPYGVTSTGSSCGNGKKGSCTYPGYIGTVFEPADEYKGDLARTYFYMATRYENVIASWETLDQNGYGDAVLDGTSWPCFEPWFLNMLCEWNTIDSVSQKERDRNNAICAIQGNRNPFIDHPEWVWEIWCRPDVGVEQQTKDIDIATVFPNPVSENLTIQLNELNSIIDKIAIYSFTSSQVLIIDKPSNNQSIDVSDFSEGLYTLVIYSGNVASRRKVVVIH